MGESGSGGASYDRFIELSSALTGFSALDLVATGVGRELYFKAIEQAGAPTIDELLSVWVDGEDASIDRAIRWLMSDPVLGPLARKVIKMWYLGVWEHDGGDQVPVSAEAYTQGLVWDAIGAHPQAAKQQGFGAWYYPPTPVSIEGRG